MTVDQKLQQQKAALEELAGSKPKRPWRRYALAAGCTVVLALLAFAWWLGLLTPEPERATLENAVAAVQRESEADTPSADTAAPDSIAVETTVAIDEVVVATTEPSSTAQVAGEWTVVPSDATFVGYRADSRVGEAVGRSPSVTGNLIATETEISAVSITADMTQLSSDSSLRDDHLGDEGLEYNTYPTSTFVLTEPITLPTEIEDEVEVAFDAIGELTVREITQPVTVALSGVLVDEKLVVVGSADVDLDDFGASVDSTDEALMEFSIVFER